VNEDLMLPVAILAGGLGTRLRPITDAIPKSLVVVRGEPFLAHQLRLLHGAGIRRVVLCVGHLAEMIRDFVGDGARFGLSVDLSFEGPELLGTAGAIRRALPLLGDRFFVLYGDSYLPCRYLKVQEAFVQSGKPGLMTVFHNEDRWDASNVELKGGAVRAYDKVVKTPRMRHIDYGLGMFHRAVFEGLPEGPYDLACVYQDLVKRGELAALEIEDRFYEVGSAEGLEMLADFLKRQDVQAREQ
jgi:NDP-sugar pyrophosphorylase family protein